ncbi:MAG: AEC family transporter [Bacteroidales bacterium]
MRVLLSIFINDVLPIFLLAGVGFLLARYRQVDVRMVSRTAFNALSPCLVFTLLMQSRIGAAELGRLGLFSVCSILGVGALAWLVAGLLRLDRALATAFIMVVTFSNTGNFGLSAILLAFGAEALARGTVYFVISATLMYTLGVFLASSGTRTVAQALRGVLRVPTVYAVAAAALLLLLRLPVPGPVDVGIKMLSDAALPVMMLVLGMQFERVRHIEQPRLVAAAALLTLVASPLLAFALADLIGLSGAARQASVLEASMPAAIMTTVIALEYDAAPTFVTGVVFVTTLVSPLSVTVVIAMLNG